MIKENWKDIKGYENFYMVSNHGDVFSKRRNRKLKPHKNSNKQKKCYKRIDLSLEGKVKKFLIHRLVWDHFSDCKIEKGYCVDHIDNDHFNNNINNLQLLTPRDNTIKELDKSKTSSKYIGVSYVKITGKYESYITNGNKKKHLGVFDNEYDAHLSYKKELNKLGNNITTSK